MKLKKCMSLALVGGVLLAVIALTYGITKGLYHDNLEDACQEDGWYMTQNYRLVCQDVNE